MCISFVRRIRSISSGRVELAWGAVLLASGRN